MEQRVEIEAILTRVDKARSAAGPKVLIGFEMHGIQELLLVSRKQPGIRGASELVRKFGTRCRALPGVIFSDAGRGALLVRQADHDSTIAKVQAEFDASIPLASLTAVGVPFNEEDQAGSLRWLRRAMDARSDCRASPIWSPGAVGGATLCQSCFRREGKHKVSWPDEKDLVLICGICRQMFGSDPERGEDSARDLSKLAQSGRLAMISADGNRFGDLFSEVETLAGYAATSGAVALVFLQALVAAGQTVSADRALVPYTGGDDVRVFIDAPAAAGFVTVFVDSLQGYAAEAGEMIAAVDSGAGRRVRGIGIGIGMAIASPDLPATRLARLAHTLERRAKRFCDESGERSAIDLAFFVNGGEMDWQRDDTSGVLDFSNGGRSWKAFLRRASSLARHVSTSQRSQLLSGRQASDEEFANQFLYQIAQAPEWKRYFQDIEIDWRDADLAVAAAPDRRDHEMARVLGR